MSRSPGPNKPAGDRAFESLIVGLLSTTQYIYMCSIVSTKHLSKQICRKVFQGFRCMCGFRRKRVARFSPQTYLKNCLDPCPIPQGSSQGVARSRRKVSSQGFRCRHTLRRKVSSQGLVARSSSQARRNVSSQALFASQEEFVFSKI